MTLDNLVTILFCLVMLANLVAFVRHWRMMRVMHIVLNNLVETQHQFNELLDMRSLPEADRRAAIEAMISRMNP
jgi:hypothetical protein